MVSDAEFDRIERDYPISAGGCPTCDGYQEYSLNGEVRKCDCAVQTNIAFKYYAASIPRRYHSLGLSDLDDAYSTDVIPLVEDYLKNFRYNLKYGRGIGLYGNQGTGKTMVAAHILKQLVKQHYSGFFIQFTDLINQWGSAWKDAESKEILEKNLKRPDILVLDDIVTDKRNSEGFLQGGLEAVLRHRYNNSLPTILTTNMTPEKLEREFPRAYSLISGVTVWWEMEGNDFRPKHSQEIEYLVANKETLPVT